MPSPSSASALVSRERRSVTHGSDETTEEFGVGLWSRWEVIKLSWAVLCRAVGWRRWEMVGPKLERSSVANIGEIAQWTVIDSFPLTDYSSSLSDEDNPVRARVCIEEVWLWMFV